MPRSPRRVLSAPLSVALATFAVAATMLSGCADAPRAPLRVGLQVWPAYEPAFLARDLGYFGDEPIELVSFTSPNVLARAYENGALDAFALTLDWALQYAAADSTQRVVLVIGRSAGGDAVLARPGIRSMRELRGRRVGLEDAPLGTYVVTRALERHGMTWRDIEHVHTPNGGAATALDSAHVDAVVVFDPERSELLARGYRELFSSAEIPGEIYDVLITRSSVLERDPAALRTLVGGWLRAVDYLEREPEDAARRVAPRERTTPERFLASLGTAVPLGAAENRRLLADGDTTLAAAAARLERVMRAHGQIAGTVDLRSLLTGELLAGPHASAGP